ncbi:MFS transporter, partial [Bifidobacterium adolescentis]
VLAGLGMVVGGIVGGRLTDLWKAGATAALSHGIALCGLLLVFLLPGNHATTALLTFIIGFALFFNSSPQQLLMVQAGEGGGELIAGAIVGGAALTATAMNYHFTGIAGAPISLLAVILLVLYTRRYEARA